MSLAMKRSKNEVPSTRRFRMSYILLGLAGFYLILIFLKFPEFLESATHLSSGDGDTDRSLDLFFSGEEDGDEEVKKLHLGSVNRDDYPRILRSDANIDNSSDSSRVEPLRLNYGRIVIAILNRSRVDGNFSVFDRMADEAWSLGLKAWEEADGYEEKEMMMNSVIEGMPESCPSSITATGLELADGDGVMLLPCGLSAGSSVTVIATPRYAHREYVPQLAKQNRGDAFAMVSQFMFELQGLKSVVGEDPPKILHLNPRLKGDWSDRPVIEHNTCYRMQWGTAHRCDGIPSKSDEDMLVDGHLRCEKWMRNDIVDSKESKIFSWFDRFIGRAKKPELTWPFPFVEGKMFILTVRAGIDGFHITVGGRHLSSFPYRTGFTLEDATGLAVRGDVEVHSVFATSLPTSHPSFSPQRVLEFSEKWKSLPLPLNPIRIFIGILSATNHFAERMAIRKTWMQSLAIKSSYVVARFFVALNPRKELNGILKKEAAFFGDIVILPFIDRYELVVLKTLSICEFGVQNVSAAYIMKCDDDNFVRLDAVLQEIGRVPPAKPLYMGNLNLLHRPLRNGKWAVTVEEWPEDVYPPYANGPGYIISSDIAKYISSQHLNNSLRLFKMEDVSMGMWVEKYNSTNPVQYSHSWKFCQYGCTDNYFTAHYQSPRQMECMWDHLLNGRVRCCNF
ncbi:hypothetical protein DM860_007923 [Cuscuta australis]|uniref:Galectin domain-containing protein n=1 Tax=Cuscuta australis TaxID=267555 RepID=A0A328E0U1_9ASTE|nr:hypothetical protein DM860_007923 [Cuscuta australis]